VEVAPGTIVVARIAEHKPSTVQPFEQVKTAIEHKLTQTRASQLAAQEGRQQLEQLRQGKDAQLQWGPAQLVSRADAKGMTEPQLRQVFKADTTRLPSYSGVEAPGGGYMILRISKVVDPASVDRAQQKSLGDGLAQMLGEEHFAAYLSSLKQKTKVRINKDAIERKQ
jgi:peptidyl-prolyl cis-trans isomerase D